MGSEMSAAPDASFLERLSPQQYKGARILLLQYDRLYRPAAAPDGRVAELETQIARMQSAMDLHDFARRSWRSPRLFAVRVARKVMRTAESAATRFERLRVVRPVDPAEVTYKAELARLAQRLTEVEYLLGQHQIGSRKEA